MKNIYKITKGQIISIWIFGIIGFIVSLGESDYSGFAIFLSILIPAILVFYTIGWINFKKNKTEEKIKTNNWIFLKKIKNLPFKKITATLAIIIVLIIIVSIVGFNLYKNKEAKEARDNYIGSINRYDIKLENAKICLSENVEKLKGLYLARCQGLYNKVYANYKDCKNDMPWQSHNECLNWSMSNYEEIDCTDETIVNEIESEYKSSCYSEISIEYQSMINYEENIVNQFLDSQPKTKYILNSDDIKKLYNLFPQDIFNDKTKDRLNNFVEKKGYKIEI